MEESWGAKGGDGSHAPGIPNEALWKKAGHSLTPDAQPLDSTGNILYFREILLGWRLADD
jgi:hypothetical protein